MEINQKEIKMVLDWALELEDRIFSIEERGLIERLIKNHVEIKEQVQIEEMRNEVKIFIKSLDKGDGRHD